MPRNEAEYDAAAEYMDALVDEIGDHPEDPRNRLIETLAALISAYDDKHYPIPESSPIEVLRYLMTEHGLTQGDLPEIGSQGVVSEILGGRPS
jgi:HTH-type transcriptional regulator/antitoxin HigA